MHVVNKVHEESGATNFFLENKSSMTLTAQCSFFRFVKIRAQKSAPTIVLTFQQLLVILKLRNPSSGGLKVLNVHHPWFTSRSFTRDWLRLRTVIHGFSHFNYATAMVHCTLLSMYVTSSWLTSTMPFYHHSCSVKQSFPHSHESFSLSPNNFCSEPCLPARLVLYNFCP